MWEQARQFIKNSSKQSKIYIGCDSIRSKMAGGKTIARYSTVVIVHKDGRHGCKIFHQTSTLADYGTKKNIRPRLLNQVMFALQAFQAIQDVIDQRYLQVHIDVNADPKYASNVVSAQALGWVKGMGLNAKIKPQGFAASYAADHCVRGKTMGNSALVTSLATN